MPLLALTSRLARSALCSLMQFLSKSDCVRILRGAEQRAASGTLVKRAVARLVESHADVNMVYALLVGN